MVISLVGCPNSDPVSLDAGTVKDAAPDTFVCEDDASEDVDLSGDTVVSADNWQLVLPREWAKQEAPKGVALLATNTKEQGLLLMTKEPYEGSYDEFAIETVRGLRGQGAEILTTSTVQANELFVYIRSQQGDLIADTWVTVKDDFGYSVSCGSLSSNFGKLSEDCERILFSFEMK